VISAAGGLVPNAGKRIYVVRHAKNGLSDTLEIRTDELFRSSASRWNISVLPSDMVNIPVRTTVKLFCLGEVRNPGAIELHSDDRISLLSVIAKAGGLTDRAANRMRVKRKGISGKDEEIVLNYGRIVSGSDPDPQLEADDVIIVPTSIF